MCLVKIPSRFFVVTMQISNLHWTFLLLFCRSVPLPKDVDHFKRERKLAISKSLQVCSNALTGGGGGTQGHMRQGGVNGAVKKLIFLLSLPTKEKILGPKCTLHLYSNITYIKHSFVTLKLQFPLCTSKDFTKFQLIPKAHLHLDPSLFCVLYIVYL